jgi:hypothetical protein
MKCIDAIEGAVKTILSHIHAVSIEDNLDDTEYVRNVRSIIEATHQFIVNNPEIVDNPQLLKDVLYGYSRTLWLTNQQPRPQEEPAKPQDIDTEREEYQTYYYDYLYHRGIYPR